MTRRDPTLKLGLKFEKQREASLPENLLDTFALVGRRALVTGASRGIGRRLAVALAEAGADVAVNARGEAALGETMEAIRALGRRALPAAGDVAQVEVCRAVVAGAAEGLGGLDILVNNAGVERLTPSSEVDETVWDAILDTNLKGAFFCAQAAAARMTGGGAILNLASLTSAVGVAGAVPYGASKSGVLGITRALATEWAGRGVRVNAIAPGYFRTAMTETFYQDDAWAERMRAAIPQARFGDLDDLAGPAVFLCSGAARYLTGQCLFVDGGYMAAL